MAIKLRQVRDDGAAVLRARWYLRSADHLGTRVRLRGRPRINNSGHLIVHDRVQLVSTTATLELATAPTATLEIGSQTFINYGTSVSASERVTIGSHCFIGTFVLIMDNDFHRLEPERRTERPDSKPVVIGDNVWLGASVIVIPGVTIGHGCAIGAGSVVTRNIPPRSLAVGSPARVIREL